MAEAFNAGDVEAALAYYAEDAVLDIHPRELAPNAPYEGHEAIRSWLEMHAAENTQVDATTDQLEQRARSIIDSLGPASASATVTVEPADAFFGGGSIPTKRLPSIAIKLTGADEAAVAHRLRSGRPPVVGRVQHGVVWLDLRTVFPSQDQQLIEALRAALPGGTTDH